MISELIINAFLVTVMLAIAIALLKTRTVIFTVILTSAYSLVAALMFITLDAVDVAFTEASVGAGISTVLFLAAMAYLPKKEEETKESRFKSAFNGIKRKLQKLTPTEKVVEDISAEQGQAHCGQGH